MVAGSFVWFRPGAACGVTAASQKPAPEGPEMRWGSALGAAAHTRPPITGPNK